MPEDEYIIILEKGISLELEEIRIKLEDIERRLDDPFG